MSKKPTVSTPEALGKNERAQARKALLASRDDLRRALDEHRGGQSRTDAARAELERLREEDDAQSDEQREFSQLMDDRESVELQAVNAALARLDDGSYGLCLTCGGDIAWPRLQAQPDAARCIDCQSKFEADQARRA